MAVPFVFTLRHLGYQIGCGVLILATILEIFGVASPGWYSLQLRKTGQSHYSHLWIVCSAGLSNCRVLSATVTKDFEKATQAFAILGVIALSGSCLGAVYLNFFTQDKGHNRWLEISAFVAGGISLLAAIIFAAGKPDYLPTNVDEAGIEVTAGYGLALTFVAAILTLISGVVIWVFNRPIAVPTDQRTLSDLRRNDPVDRMHFEIELDAEAGFRNPGQRGQGSLADPPPNYNNLERRPNSESSQPAESNSRARPSAARDRRQCSRSPDAGGFHPVDPPRREQSRLSDPHPRLHPECDVPGSDLHKLRSASCDETLTKTPLNQYSNLAPGRALSYRGVDEVTAYGVLEPDNSSPPHYSSYYLYSEVQHSKERAFRSPDDYGGQRKLRPVSLHSSEGGSHGLSVSQVKPRPPRNTSQNDENSRHHYPKHDVIHNARSPLDTEGKLCNAIRDEQGYHYGNGGLQPERAIKAGKPQRHSRDVTEADIDMPQGLPPPLYTQV